MATSVTNPQVDTPDLLSLTDIYLVNESDKDILLNLKIGPAMVKAVSNVKLESKTLLSEHEGQISNLKAGTNKTVNAKFLTIKTVATHILGQPRNIQLELEIKGGIETVSYPPLRAQIKNDGDTIFFEIEIFFIN